MAAPHVSGVLLLLLDAQPNLSYPDAMSILKNTTFRWLPGVLSRTTTTAMASFRPIPPSRWPCTAHT